MNKDMTSFIKHADTHLDFSKVSKAEQKVFEHSETSAVWTIVLATVVIAITLSTLLGLSEPKKPIPFWESAFFVTLLSAGGGVFGGLFFFFVTDNCLIHVFRKIIPSMKKEWKAYVNAREDFEKQIAQDKELQISLASQAEHIVENLKLVRDTNYYKPILRSKLTDMKVAFANNQIEDAFRPLSSLYLLFKDIKSQALEYENLKAFEAQFDKEEEQEINGSPLRSML